MNSQTTLYRAILELSQPVPFYPGLARAIGSRTASLMLCQLIYWSQESEWVTRSAEEWEAATTLTYKEQRTARAVLRDLGLVEETRQRLMHVTRYRVIQDRVNVLLPNGLSPSALKADEVSAPRAVGERPKGSSISSSKQEATAVQKQKQEKGGEPTWPSPAALVKLYNEQAPDECPTARDLSPKRKVKAQAALSAFADQDWWDEVFAQMRASRFLRGMKNGSGHPKWVADLDWLLAGNKDGTENYVLVHDGRYLDG